MSDNHETEPSDSPDPNDQGADGWQDELVAYLDGEVSAGERERIEERLTDDEVYRSKLVELERSWRLLDRLPTAGEDKDFTKSTIALVTEELRNPSGQHAFDHAKTSSATDGTTAARSSSPQRRFPWGVLAATLCAGLLGFLAVFLSGRGDEQRELRDLPLAANLQLYRYAESVEFVEMLCEQGLFVTSTDDTSSTTTVWSESKNPSVIRIGIQQLTAKEKQDLLEQLRLYHELDSEEKERLRIMQQKMTGKSDSVTLFRVLKGYRKWLMTLQALERADLLDIKDPKERALATSELHKEDGGTLVNPDGSKFAVSEKELEEYFLSLDPSYRDELKQKPPNEMRDQLKRWYFQDLTESATP